MIIFCLRLLPNWSNLEMRKNILIFWLFPSWNILLTPQKFPYTLMYELFYWEVNKIQRFLNFVELFSFLTLESSGMEEPSAGIKWFRITTNFRLHDTATASNASFTFLLLELAAFIFWFCASKTKKTKWLVFWFRETRASLAFGFSSIPAGCS